ncbi:MAG: AmmeMemoRadiSam system radical SAM enzyme [Bacteroidales bacterium]|nr:AmmeMemoRadiSam system radical SAM enzyme [Bacteroidales bacterium]
MKEASYYTRENGKVRCFLCPHNCLIAVDKRGICRVRKNVGGKLIAETWEQVCSLHFDPIEKKPLYHFYPGQTIFSVGSVGCNLHCKFCQNCEISQVGVDEYPFLHTISTEEIVNKAVSIKENIGIAYTYNEPTVWFEFMAEIAKQAKSQNLKNVMVTNGFINPEPLEDSLEFMDAYSVDLKAFDENFYKKITSSWLQPVLETLKTIKKSGKHFEITNLVITNTNDDPDEFKEMIDWIAEELGKDTVLHISRYHPTYKMSEPSTPETTLNLFFELASKKLDYVYLGNLHSLQGQNTYCPNCKTEVIKRTGYLTEVTGLDKVGNCESCQYKIIKYRI